MEENTKNKISSFLENQLIISRDVGYLSSTSYADLALQLVKVHKILNAFISSTRSL